MSLQGRTAASFGDMAWADLPYPTGATGTSDDTELEKLKKGLQFVVNCIDCFVS
jgi:hypothetical protein